MGMGKGWQLASTLTSPLIGPVEDDTIDFGAPPPPSLLCCTCCCTCCCCMPCTDIAAPPLVLSPVRAAGDLLGSGRCAPALLASALHSCKHVCMQRLLTRCRMRARHRCCSFGRVFVGRWAGRTVAIKVIEHDSSTLAAVENEFSLMMSFNHDNVRWPAQQQRVCLLCRAWTACARRRAAWRAARAPPDPHRAAITALPPSPHSRWRCPRAWKLAACTHTQVVRAYHSCTYTHTPGGSNSEYSSSSFVVPQSSSGGAHSSARSQQHQQYGSSGRGRRSSHGSERQQPPDAGGQAWPQRQQRSSGSGGGGGGMVAGPALGSSSSCRAALQANRSSQSGQESQRAETFLIEEFCDLGTLGNYMAR